MEAIDLIQAFHIYSVIGLLTFGMSWKTFDLGRKECAKNIMNSMLSYCYAKENYAMCHSGLDS